MALLSQAIKEKEYDNRTIERSMSKGLMHQDAVNKQLKTLQDEESLAEYTNTEELFVGIEGKSQLRD